MMLTRKDQNKHNLFKFNDIIHFIFSTKSLQKVVKIFY